MIRINKTREIYLDELRDYVAELVRPHALEIIRNSEKIWEIRDRGRLVMYVGLVQRSMVGDCNLWCMAGEALTTSHARWLLRLFERVLARFGRFGVGVRTGNKMEERFARFLGFRPVREMGPFTYFEVAKWQQ